MSGLINRMVRRARGTLPSVEPLLGSHQTASAVSGFSIEETFTGTMAPSNGTPRVAPMRSPLVRPPLPSMPAPLPTFDRGPLYTDFRKSSGTRLTPAKKRTQDTEQQATADRLPEAQKKQSSEKDASLGDTPRDPVVLEVHAAKRAIAETPSPEIDRSAAGTSTQKSAAQTTSTALKPQWKRTEPHVTPPLESTTEHTEIHVTIGSIELRAPRSEAPRPSTPFKPRVTLDDYLRDKPGANS